MNSSQIVGNTRPLVSVVVPTKNRAMYAQWTIQSCLRLGGECEVVVADSGSDETLLRSLTGLGIIDKIIYVKTSPAFSVVDNFNEAVAHASGLYITCIGDDDIVTSALIDVAKTAQYKNIECVSFSFPITYWWPDFAHRRRGSVDAGSIGVAEFTGRLQSLNPGRELAVAAGRIGSGPQKMPRIYAGLVHRTLVERIKDKHGNLFGGVSPDVYSSTLLANECKSLVYIDYPVIVPGLSGGSTSGTSSNGKHLGKLRENNHIAPFRDLVWDERIPEYYSVPTVWSFSMLKALTVISREDNANLFGIYLKCTLYTRGFAQEIGRSFRIYCRARSNGGLIRDFCGAMLNEARFVAGAVGRRLIERLVRARFKRYISFENTAEASVRIDALLRERPFTTDCLSK